MTAPTRTRAQARRDPTQRASQRSAGPRQSRSRTANHPPIQHGSGPRASRQRGRGTAAQKAYARRAQRSETMRGGGHPVLPPGIATALRLRLPSSRAGFVLMLMGLLVVGVVLTLWLSTQAIADSYRLEKVRAETASLAERAERLQRDVTRQQTASALAERARALGMVPSGEPARILVKPNGKTKLFGEPTKARPQPMPAPARKPAGQEVERPPRTGGDRDTTRDAGNSPDRDTTSETRRQQVQAAGARHGGDEAAGGQ